MLPSLPSLLLPLGFWLSCEYHTVPVSVMSAPAIIDGPNLFLKSSAPSTKETTFVRWLIMTAVVGATAAALQTVVAVGATAAATVTVAAAAATAIERAPELADPRSGHRPAAMAKGHYSPFPLDGYAPCKTTP